MDVQIGRVLEALDANGLTDNTIVIFTSDNGGERFADTWPFTGRKTELLEGGLRIPAIISWPARIPQGKTSEQVAITMDWLPTLLAAAGAAPDPAFPPDGMNLLPVLTRRMPRRSRRKLFWRYKANAQRAVRDGDFKFLKIRRQHVPVQRRRGSDGARQPEGAAEGRLRSAGRASGSRGTRRCCPKFRKATPAATTAIGGPTISASGAQPNRTTRPRIHRADVSPITRERCDRLRAYHRRLRTDARQDHDASRLHRAHRTTKGAPAFGSAMS